MAYSLGTARVGYVATAPSVGTEPERDPYGAALFDPSSGDGSHLATGAPAPTMAAMRDRGDLIRVDGGARLEGEVRVAGAKNSALKLVAAALLAEGRTELANVPRITDIAIMAAVLRRLGCIVTAPNEAVDADTDAGDL